MFAAVAPVARERGKNPIRVEPFTLLEESNNGTWVDVSQSQKGCDPVSGRIRLREVTIQGDDDPFKVETLSFGGQRTNYCSWYSTGTWIVLSSRKRVTTLALEGSLPGGPKDTGGDSLLGPASFACWGTTHRLGAPIMGIIFAISSRTRVNIVFSQKDPFQKHQKGNTR